MVGASPDWIRPSYFVMKYLLRKGFNVIPVNPRAAGQEILGQKVYSSLSEIPVKVDVVDVFRRAEYTPGIAEAAVARGAKVLWLQEGIANDDARRIGEEGGLSVVMGVCMRQETKRLERSERES